MGLLDEAIREHLDLKRRRGADPTEIERAEREALGPVRRGPETAEADELAVDAGGELPAGYDPGAEPDWEEPYPSDGDSLLDPDADAVPADEAPTAFHEPPVQSEELLESDPYDVPLPRDEPDAYKHPLPEDDEPSADPHPAPHPAQGPASPPHGDETIEYSVEEATGERDEDVLEETPEFLQDAPEHDRLWFEQRPPRDFDFNE
jgi:hypothetical protein